MDRGGDRQRLHNSLINKGLKFTIRLTGTRDLMFRGRKRNSLELAKSCPMSFLDQIIRGTEEEEEEEEEKTCQISYGFRQVKLPGKNQQLFLFVVNGFVQEPMMMLTNVPVKKARKSLWFIVEGYLSHWLVKDAIRFINQSYNIEDIRLLSYRRLQNMMALILAAVYFSSVCLGNTIKLPVPSSHVIKASKRFYGVTEFCYYALTDGISVLLSRIRPSAFKQPTPPTNSAQTILPCFS